MRLRGLYIPKSYFEKTKSNSLGAKQSVLLKNRTIMNGSQKLVTSNALDSKNIVENQKQKKKFTGSFCFM